MLSLLAAVVLSGPGSAGEEVLVWPKAPAERSLPVVLKSYGTIHGKNTDGFLMLRLGQGKSTTAVVPALRRDSRIRFAFPASAQRVDRSSLRSVKDFQAYLQALDTVRPTGGKPRTEALGSHLYWLERFAGQSGEVDWTMFGRAAEARDALPPAKLGNGTLAPMARFQFLGPRSLSYERAASTHVSGRVNDIAVAARQGLVMYAAAQKGGLYKFKDGEWIPLSDRWPQTQVTSVAVDPNNNNIVYAGTGDFPSSKLPGFGLYKTENAGVSWTTLGAAEFGTMTIADVVVHSNSTTLIVGTGNAPDWRFGHLWVSTTSGRTWTLPARVGGQPLPGTWSGIDYTLNDDGQRTYFAVMTGRDGRGQVWTSLDGVNWQRTAGTPPFPTLNQGTSLEIACSRRLTSDGPNTVYVLAPQDRRIFKSTNAGATWLDITGNFPAAAWSQLRYNTAIGVRTSSTMAGLEVDMIYVGLVGMYKSTGGGLWEDATSRVHHVDLHAMTNDPTNSRAMLLGNDGGVARYQDDQAPYSFSSSLTNFEFYGIDVHPTDRNHVIGGLQDNHSAVNRGDASFASWKLIGAGDGGHAKINQSDGQIQYVQAQTVDSSALVYKTVDAWNTDAYIGFSYAGERGQFMLPTAMGTGANANDYYTATNYLHRYNGTAWQHRVGGQELASGDGIITAIEASPSDANRIYTSSSVGDIYVSRNHGDNWSRLNDGSTPGTYANSISVHPAKPADILVGFSPNDKGTLFHCTSVDGATRTWVRKSAGLPPGPVFAIARDPHDPDSTWYVGMSSGLYMTGNAGATWQRLTVEYGLPNVLVVDLVVRHGYLYVGTSGRGMWRIPLHSLGVSRIDAPAEMNSNTNAQAVLTLTAYAPSATQVSIQSSAPELVVPASVTVPAGASTVRFPLAARAVSGDLDVKLSATYNGTTVHTTVRLLPPNITALTVTPFDGFGGQDRVGRVTISTPAGSGGLRVLVSDDSVTLTTPFAVVITSGQTEATFPVRTSTVGSDITRSVIVSTPNSGTFARVRLRPGGLSAVSFSPATVVSGQTTNCTVSLTAPSPTPGGTTVFLNDNSDAMETLASITIPQGSTSSTFPLRTLPSAGTAARQVTASLGSATKAGTLTLTSALRALHVSSSIYGGSAATGSVALYGPAPTGGAVVALSTNSSSIGIPSSVTIAASASSATFTIQTPVVNTAATRTISASYGGITKVQPVTIAPNDLESMTINSASVRGGTSTFGYVILMSPAPSGGLQVTLGSSDSRVASVPTIVTVPAGARTGRYDVRTFAVTSPRSVTITATRGITRQVALSVTP